MLAGFFCQPSLNAASHNCNQMRDKKDNATFDLPGFGMPAALAQETHYRTGKRIRKTALKQVQLELLDPTDNSGLPVWIRDDNTDLTGLPVWARTDGTNIKKT